MVEVGARPPGRIQAPVHRVPGFVIEQEGSRTRMFSVTRPSLLSVLTRRALTSRSSEAPAGDLLYVPVTRQGVDTQMAPFQGGRSIRIFVFETSVYTAFRSWLEVAEVALLVSDSTIRGAVDDLYQPRTAEVNGRSDPPTTEVKREAFPNN